MTQQQLNDLLDALFWDFEQNKFINNGVWPYQTNLVFAFADYIENIDMEEILPFLPHEAIVDLELIKNYAKQGIDCWLDANMKTLMM